jgi:hypothetical protein
VMTRPGGVSAALRTQQLRSPTMQIVRYRLPERRPGATQRQCLPDSDALRSWLSR